MTDELKPCHCRRKPCIHRACLNNETYQRFAVVCSCGMNTDYWESEQDAIEKWNNRPIEDALVHALEDMLAEKERSFRDAGWFDDVEDVIATDGAMTQARRALALAKGGNNAQ